MRFVVDECTGLSVARWLREEGHDVYSVYDQARGIDDDQVIAKAYQEGRILSTTRILAKWYIAKKSATGGLYSSAWTTKELRTKSRS